MTNLSLVMFGVLIVCLICAFVGVCVCMHICLCCTAVYVSVLYIGVFVFGMDVYMSVLSVYVVNGFIGNASSATITYSTGANLVQKVEERLVGHRMGWELAKMPPSLLLQKLLTSTARNL